MQPIACVNCAADLLWSRVLKEFPTIKIAMSEGGIGWIPYFLERADYVHAHHHYWTHQDFGGKKPSEVWREHMITCFIDDPVGIKNRHAIGVDTITWECDYPHSDTTWPRVAGDPVAQPGGRARRRDQQDHPRERAALLPASTFKHRAKEKCTAAALRAEVADVDLSIEESQGGKPPAADTRGR